MEIWILIVLLILFVALMGMGILLWALVHRLNRLEGFNQEETYEQERMDSRFSTLQQMISAVHGESMKNLALNSRMEASMSEIASIMTNTKRRGTWGEYQLETLLRLYVGHWPGVLETQKVLGNGKIVDAAFHMPQTDKVICIDSKFPMENYMNILECEPQDEGMYQKLFERNMRKHIHDIQQKYILPDETAEFAILFLPSEAVYLFVCSECPEVMEYAMSNKVLLAGPTNLGAFTFTLLGVLRDSIRHEKIQDLEKDLFRFEEDLSRLLKRQQELGVSVKAAAKKFDTLENDSYKLAARFDQMMNIPQEDVLFSSQKESQEEPEGEFSYSYERTDRL